MKSSESVGIGDIAERFGLATHVLRHWESMGLLRPARVSGRRRYTADDVYRVAAILRGKKAGLSLEQIQRMIATTDPSYRVGVLRAQRTELERRIAATQAELDVINSVLRCRHPDFTQCPNFRKLIDDPAHAETHRHRSRRPSALDRSPAV